jgi:hypothetical protein
MTDRPAGEGPRPTPEFERFSHALKRVLSVSKKELDQRLAAQRANKKHPTQPKT